MGLPMSSRPPVRMVLERVPYDPTRWEATIAGHPDLEVYHGAGWLDYLVASQGAEPVIAIVRADGEPVGHFVGAIVRRYGIRILGSPLPGWTTQTMGFLLDGGVDRRAAAEALLPFAFRDLGCLHVELADRHLTADQMAGSGYVVEVERSFVIDLARPEEDVFAGMHAKTRQYVRKAEREGLRAEAADDVEFAEDFHAHLVDVFARQGLAPTYGVERVRQLITALQPTGQLLLIRVIAADGACVGTGIVVGRNRIAVNWGAAAPRAALPLHPNEVFWWAAIREWRARGAVTYDMGGDGEYKAKYGGVERPALFFHRSRFAVLDLARSGVRRLVRARQRWAARGITSGWGP